MTRTAPVTPRSRSLRRPGSLPGRAFLDVSLVSLIALAAGWPLLLSGALVTDDGLEHVIRAWALGAQIAGGDWLPRWIPPLGLGHGFPLFVAYAPGLYYPMAGIAPVVGGYLAAAEWITLGLIFTLATGAYCLGARWQGRGGGLLAAAATAGAPYVLLDAESRGSLPELAVIAALPWLILAIEGTVEAVGRRRAIWCCLLGAVGAALIWVYTFGPILVLPVALAFAIARIGGLVKPDRRAAITGLAIAAAIAFGLSSLFWLPTLALRDAIAEGPQAAEATLDWNFRSVGDLAADWQSQVGSAWWDRLAGNLSRSPAATDLPGILSRPMAPPVALVVWAILGPVAAWRLGSPARWRIGGLAAGGLICLGLTLDGSRWLWDLAPPLGYIQFPWRFFGPASVALGLCLAYLPAVLPSRIRWIAAGGLALGLIALGLGNVSIARYPVEEAALTQSAVRRRELIGHVGTTSGAGQILPRWVASGEAIGRSAGPAGQGAGLPVPEVLDYAEAGPAVTFHTQSAVAGRLVLPRFYFPIWSVRIEGRPVDATPTQPDGLLSFEVPAGDHDITVDRRETEPEVAAAILTALTGLAVAAWLGAAWGGQRGAAAGITGILIAAAALRLVPGRADPVRFEPVPEPIEPRVGPSAIARWIESVADGHPRGRILWATTDTLGDVTGSQVRLLDDADRPIALADRAPLDGAFPIDRWPGGLLLADDFDLPLPGGLPAGTYRLEAGWTPAGPAPVRWQSLGSVDVPLTPGEGANPVDESGALLRLIRGEVADGPREVINHQAEALPAVVRSARPGEVLTTSLTWLPNRPIGEDFEPVLQLIDHRQRRVAAVVVDRLQTLVLTSQWRPGRPAPTAFALRLPPDLPSGRYDLVVSFFLPDPDRRLKIARPGESSQDAITVAQVIVIQPALPPPPRALQARFPDTKLGGELELFGSDAPDSLPGPTASTTTLPVTLWWRARGTLQGFTVTVQVLDEAGRLVAQHDSPPREGALPTDLLPPNAEVTDLHPVALPPGLPPGTYQVVVGLYDPATGERLTPEPSNRPDRLVDVGRLTVGAPRSP